MNRKRVLNLVVLVGVAGVAYSAGAAGKKAAVMTAAGEIKWAEMAPGSPVQIAALWGDRGKGGDYGALLKFPGGSEAGMHSHSLDYYAVNLTGTWTHTPEGSEAKELPPGSYVMQPGKQNHNDACKAGADCIILVHQHGKGDMIPAKAAAPAKGAAAAPAPAPAPAAAAPAKAAAPAPAPAKAAAPAPTK